MRRPATFGGVTRWALHAFGCVALALAADARGLAPLAQVPRPANRPEPLQTITRWANDYRRLGANLEPAADENLASAFTTLRLRFMAIEESENDALLALCDLAVIAKPASDLWIAQGRYIPDARESTVRDGARGVLRVALDAPSGEGRGNWLATNVLALEREQPISRRIAVAEALIGRHWDSTLLALFSASAASERGLREVSVTALSGWRSDAVDRYLARVLLHALREPDFLSTKALLEHFAARKLPVDSPAAIDLASALAQASISTSWREAVRRIPLTRTLPNELAVPHLIEALALWHERGARGESSRRVEAVIVRELELRSDRHLGMVAERWATWWKAERAKSLGSGAQAQKSEPQTQAAFFGLHPWTDRVVFVIDRSGSMAERIGTSSGSRYSEALRQLALYLQQLGPRTHFNLILFSDEAHSWSGALKTATPTQIDAALQWARGNPPRGGTMLRPAITRALELDPKTSQPDLERLEADSVIVLCDGGTAEGPAWVAPLLREVADSACVRFDCVQIGTGGDGTLEALAAESGGQFVRVDS